ncbi:interferon-inducible GTPase 5-like [Xyrichtys novacula]|uniref:Interferon-inducible GTPase 5-like n=1 Tax=Xyrichtys novacula TaxID=13765 RepID=A0AAV1GM20_XYRNO|nr:interferon-inducible GTPase 5-like [Xyrichtys novacula]
MENLSARIQEEVRQSLQNNDLASAASKIRGFLRQEESIPLNIAVTGEAGSGKSTFVNAIRGIDNGDEGAAPTGTVETTMERTPYPHPHFPSITIWDLPGIGTRKFPVDKYLEHVGFERFDFFIIVSAERFRENDVRLAKEIQKMGKKFYYVRSKTDQDIHNGKRSQRDFNEAQFLRSIRKDCVEGLQKEGFQSPQVFLISSFELHLYDFPLLEETLERELPQHKRDTFLLAMPNMSQEIINRKKEAYSYNIKYYSALSAAAGGVPIPGLGAAVDTGLVAHVVNQYVIGFGLDRPSLQRLSTRTGVPLDELMKVISSPLAAGAVTSEVILKILAQSAGAVTLMAAKGAVIFIPLLGILTSMALSFTTTYRALSYFLQELADDAQRVFRRALGLNTTV